MKEIHKGAEAFIYKDEDKVVKKRFPKSYRLKELDDEIRGFRTRREAKVLGKLSGKLPVPKVISCDGKETIEMEFIDGEKLSDSLNPDSMEEVGKIIAKLHDSDMVHGDLTTSNMILKDKVYLIDFGLSFFTAKVEDKAVDIHLLKEALNAKHFNIFEDSFNNFLEGYKSCKEFDEVMKRLESVESRGKYKKKGGKK